MTSPTCSAAISAERSVDALSITITSPVRPELWMPSHASFDDVADGRLLVQARDQDRDLGR
jgi:hypothetical protein